MPVRDVEISRLINYAKGLNIKVTFNSGDSDCYAEWHHGNEIVVYSKRHRSKIEIILTLIHELGHQLHFIHEGNRQLDHKVIEALDNAESKSARKIVLEDEKKAIQYWEVIYKDTNMSFPIYKLFRQMKIDIWKYEFFHENGRFPKKKECQQFILTKLKVNGKV